MKAFETKSQKYIYITILLLFTTIFLYLLYLLIFGGQCPPSFTASLLLIHCCALIPLLKKAMRAGFNLFEPSYVFVLFYYFFWCLSSVVVYNSENVWKSSSTANIYDYSTVTRMNVFLGISILMFQIGYGIITKKMVFDIKQYNIVSPLSNDKLIRLLYAVSIIYRIIGYATGQMGSLSHINGTGFSFPGVSIINFISNIWYVYYAYFIVKYMFERQYKYQCILYTIVEIMIVFIGGDRRYILTIALIVIATVYYSRKELPWKYIIIGALSFAFLFVPITTLYGYLLDTTNGGLSENLNLLGYVLSYIQELSFVDIWSDYIIYPLFSQSLFTLPPCLVGYTDIDIRNLNWGPIPLYQMLSQIIPSFFIQRLDFRYYYELFATFASSRQTDYYSGTFSMPLECVVCYGLEYLPLLYFMLGIVVGWIYKKLFYGSAFSRVIYISQIFTLTYCFQYGFLTTELTTPMRVIIYFFIFSFLSKKCAINKPKYQL